MLPFTICDVFTDTPFSGNPLAIVEGADDLSTAQMQTIARQFNLSETIFVMRPANPGHTARVRIFFPTAEIPFAGHPTIGCALHLAGDSATQITLEEEAGLVPVTITRDDKGTSAEFTAPKRLVAVGHVPPRADVVRALDLRAQDLGTDRIAAFEGGPVFLYVPVASLDALARARPIEPHWSDLLQTVGGGCDAAYLYAPGHDTAYQARMFSPTAGIPEDPATGSATALLAAQLLANGHLQDGTTQIMLAQGVEMGRPSRLRLSIDVANGTIGAIRVAGQAVEIARGHIRVPAA